MGYFLQPKKARATGCLVCGILLVMVGHPVIGIFLEIFRLLNLFGNMFPLVMMMAKNFPVVGGLFGSDSGNGSSGRKEKSRKILGTMIGIMMMIDIVERENIGEKKTSMRMLDKVIEFSLELF